MPFAEYLRDQPETLAELLLVVKDFEEFATLLEKLRRHADRVKDGFLEAIQAPMPLMPTTGARDSHWKKQSLAANALVHLGSADLVWPLLKHSPDPSLRSFLIHDFGRLRADYKKLAARLQIESDVSIRRALILSLGRLNSSLISSTDRKQLVDRLLQWFYNDPDPGIHGAADWALRQWRVTIERPAKPLLGTNHIPPVATSRLQWYVNQQGQTMAIIYNSAADGPGTLDHNFAIAAHEVTVDEFRRYREDHQVDENVAPDVNCPVNSVSWYDAVAYCNWLCGQEGIPREQWCYQPNDQGDFSDGMTVSAEVSQCIGYRLPTQAEWEYACRAMSETAYSFGEPLELLANYAWFGGNSNSRTYPVGTLLPNEFGLFDLHGHLWEWCQRPNSGGKTPGVGNRNWGVLRGGSFGAQPKVVRSALSHRMLPKLRTANIGFRLARTMP